MRLIVSSMSVPPRSLAPACRSLAAPAGPEFHPRDLDVRNRTVEHQSGHGRHEDVLAQSGSRSGFAREVQGRVLMHERQSDEFGEPTGSLLDLAQRAQVPDPVRRGVHMAVHHRGTRRQSDLMRGTTSIHASAGSLPFVRTQRTSSSRISAAVPGIESRPDCCAVTRKSGC